MTHKLPQTRPRLLLTLGDVAGIGPEIIARAWPDLQPLCRPLVVGDPYWLQQGLNLVEAKGQVVEVTHPADREPSADVLPCLRGSSQDLTSIVSGRVQKAAGQAAYDFLCCAIDLTLGGEADGIVTAPLHKE